MDGTGGEPLPEMNLGVAEFEGPEEIITDETTAKIKALTGLDHTKAAPERVRELKANWPTCLSVLNMWLDVTLTPSLAACVVYIRILGKKRATGEESSRLTENRMSASLSQMSTRA